MLALAAGDAVTRQQVVAGLWGTRPPEDPVSSLASLVERVTATLPQLRSDDEVLTLAVSRAEVDALVFEDELAAARSTADPAHASALLESALGLWRGEALAGLRDVPFAADAAQALDERRLDAVGAHGAWALRLGHHRARAEGLRGLVGAPPTRQQLWALLMTALYRDFRAEEAVAVYAEARTAIAEELGLEPGEALQQLEAAILRNDPSL